MDALSKSRTNNVHFGKVATYFSVTLEWIQNGSVEILQESYINRELISFDRELTLAFDKLDSIDDPETREAVKTVVKYYRYMEVFITQIAEQVLYTEDILKFNKIAYSESSFEHLKHRLHSLKKADDAIKYIGS